MRRRLHDYHKRHIINDTSTNQQQSIKCSTQAATQNSLEELLSLGTERNYCACPFNVASYSNADQAQEKIYLQIDMSNGLFGNKNLGLCICSFINNYAVDEYK